MQTIKDAIYDQERALYGAQGVEIINCRFDGPADGESALKESCDISVRDSYFNLRYPFWHDSALELVNCELTPNCRAALWYTDHARIAHSRLHGIKALRECHDIALTDCDVDSPEFGWNTRDVDMERVSVKGEYFMLNARELRFRQLRLEGKYSFQYVTDAEISASVLNTKDAFWHSSHITVRDSEINGEYLGWYSDHLTLIDCTISGTQPLCYCTNLRLINCRMSGADFAFERSHVQAELTTPIISVKNPYSGSISAPAIGEIIRDDPRARGVVTVTG